MRTPAYDRSLREHGVRLIARSRELRKQSLVLREQTRRIASRVEQLRFQEPTAEPSDGRGETD